MRRTQFRSPVTVATGADTVIAPVNPKRVRIEIWVSRNPHFLAQLDPGANLLSVAPYILTAITQGILIGIQEFDGNLDGGVPPRSYQVGGQSILNLVMDIETHGDVVQQDWHSIAQVQGSGFWSVIVVETIKDDCRD